MGSVRKNGPGSEVRSGRESRCMLLLLQEELMTSEKRFEHFPPLGR